MQTKFGVLHRFLSKLRKEGDELLRKADEEQISLHAKSIYRSHHPDIETKVYHFCEIAKQAKIPVTRI